jgi:hypothetical protein
VLLAVPAASTKGSTGRQHVVAARRLPTAEIAAADVPFEGDFVVVLTVSVFMMPAPVFTVWSLAGLSALPDKRARLAEDRLVSIRHTDGNSAQGFERPAILQRRLVH